MWAAGNELAEVLPDAWGKAAVSDLIDARESRYVGALEKIMTYLGGERSITTTLEAGLFEPQGEPRNPYKGLQAFTQRDTNDFFGRDALAQGLVETIREMLIAQTDGPRPHNGLYANGGRDTPIPTGRLLPVIGASGSGKSSVVMAGLLPLLQCGALPGSAEWIYLPAMVPGQRPLESLALALVPYLPTRSLASISEDLADDSVRDLHRLATQLVRRPQARVVLLVDQFEELFSQTISEEERRRFIDLLVTAATEPHGPVIVILTLRIDFYGHTVNYPELYRLIETNAKTVLPMDIQELRAVIEEPAALPDVQLTFEGNLVGDLLFEVHGQAGALPLLSFTLEQLFQHRNGRQLTLEAYKNIGGVKGALAKQAETTYMSLPSEEHRRLARALFLRLIDPGITEQDTRRRRAALTELSLPDAKQTAILREVADAFITARLLAANEIAGVTTVEVSHEALIREWTRLADWLCEGREDIHVQQTLDEDIAEWERRNKPNDRLYHGSQSKEANVWAKRNIPSKHEVAFLRASTTRRMRVLVSVIALIFLLFSSTGLAVWQGLHTSNPTLVTTVDDSGPGSLRQAIVAAKPGDTITFDPALKGKTIILHDSLDITKSLKILGPGADVLSISTGSTARLHIVDVFEANSVTISDLSFKDSNVDEVITNSGTLTLISCTISGNKGPVGGFGGTGIDNSGTLMIRKSTIANNNDIGIENFGTLTLQDSIVSDNQNGDIYRGGFSYNEGGFINGRVPPTPPNNIVPDKTATSGGYGFSHTGLMISSAGGGITNAGTLVISNSIISHNAASILNLQRIAPPPDRGASGMLLIAGGGILNTGSLTLTNSTIADNTASSSEQVVSPKAMRIISDGGGIANTGKLTLTNSTLSGNKTGIKGFNSNASINSSGGIANYGGQADIAFCTIYNNSNTGQGNGGGIFTGDGEDNKGNKRMGSLQLRDSIVAGNSASSDPDIAGMLITGGYNLFQDTSGAMFINPNNKHSTDLVGVKFSDLDIDPQLRENDALTPTLALFPGGPAIDAIPPAECMGVTTDQRGVKRPQGRGCDIGAYEYEAP